jgi:hypothetical protein
VCVVVVVVVVSVCSSARVCVIESTGSLVMRDAGGGGSTWFAGFIRALYHDRRYF